MNKKLLFIGLVLLMMLPLVSAVGNYKAIFVTSGQTTTDYLNGGLFQPNATITNITINSSNYGLGVCQIWNFTASATTPTLVSTLGQRSVAPAQQSCEWNTTLILKQNDLYVIVAGRNISAYGTVDQNATTTYPLTSPIGNFINGSYRGYGVPVFNSSTVARGFGNFTADILSVASAGSNLSFTASNFYTGASISSFCVNITGNYTCTTNGTAIFTTILTNSSQLWTVEYLSNESGGYFNQTYTGVNVSGSLSKTMAQSVQTFTATEYISNASVNGATFTSVYLTNSTHYASNGTFTINASKTGYYTQPQTVTFVALATQSHVIENMTATRINLTVRDAITNLTVNTYSVQMNNSVYSFTKTASTTNGTILTDAINGTWRILINATGYAYSTLSYALTNGTNNITAYIYTSESINVTFKNELTGAVINSSTVFLELISSVASYNYSTTTGYKYFDLVSPTNYTLRYYASGYTQRFSYLEISSRSNQNLTLYLLPSTSTTNVTLTVIDENAKVVQSALVRVLKYDLTTNSYIERETKYTNYAGQILTGVELNTEFYKFIVEYPTGTVVLTTQPAYILSTTLTLQIDTGALGSNLDDYLNIDSQLTFNSATNNFRVDYSNSQNLLGNVCIYAYRTDLQNKTLSNYSCSTDGTQSGSILVTVYNQSGREYQAQLFYILDGESYYVSSKSVSFDQGTDWGIWGLLIIAVITIIIVFMFKESLVLVLAIAPLPLVAGSFTGLILLPVSASIGIAILSWVLAYFVSRYAQ